jgi:hypothetical protein
MDRALTCGLSTGGCAMHVLEEFSFERNKPVAERAVDGYTYYGLKLKGRELFRSDVLEI